MAQSFGRRTANQQSKSGTAAKTADNITLGPVKRTVVVEDGEYQVTVTGARAITSKTGATSVILAAEHDGEGLRLQPMLVASPGGPSDLTADNIVILKTIAALDVDGESTLADLINELAGKQCLLELKELTDKQGNPINRVVDAIVEE